MLLCMWAGLSCFLSSGDGYVGEILDLQQGVKDPLEVPEARLISLETPPRKWASSRLEGRTSWIFSSCSRSSRLTRGTSGPALVASGKASPHASCSGAFRDSSPVNDGA